MAFYANQPGIFQHTQAPVTGMTIDAHVAKHAAGESIRVQAKAELARAKADRGASGDDNAQLRGAKAALETAKLNLDFTRVEASVDGYVTNLNLRLGSQAVANQPALALVDVNSFWVPLEEQRMVE